jgi:hypothetical protein
MAAGRKYEAVDDDETGTGKATRAPEKAIRTPEKALGARAVARSELGLIWNIAWPTGISTLLRAGTQQSTVMIVGHMLGAEALGAVGLGTMWVNISGLSIVFGGMSALDTLCSQAYGAQNYKLVGLWAQVRPPVQAVPLARHVVFSRHPGRLGAARPHDHMDAVRSDLLPLVLWHAQRVGRARD